MEELKVLEELFDNKIISVLKVFYRETGKDYYLQEISTISEVSIATCSRILARLVKLEIVELKKISRFKLYRLSESKKAKFLSKLFKEDHQIMKIFVESAKNIPGIVSIILHGKEAVDRANVLLIGESINAGSVKAVCAQIKEKYNFIVSPLSLTPEQYSQMSQMGLYSGQKKILYEAEA